MIVTRDVLLMLLQVERYGGENIIKHIKMNKNRELITSSLIYAKSKWSLMKSKTSSECLLIEQFINNRR